MSTFNLDELESAIEAAFENHEENPDAPYDWYEMEEAKDWQLGEFGVINGVEGFGGEGQGDEMWVVFTVGDRYFKKTAYYDSWNGADWENGYFKEVVPKQVMRTEYEIV